MAAADRVPSRDRELSPGRSFPSDRPITIAIELNPEAWPIDDHVQPGDPPRWPPPLRGVIDFLQRHLEFRLSAVGWRTLSVRGTVEQFERAFKVAVTELSMFEGPGWSAHSWLTSSEIELRDFPRLAPWVAAISIQPPHKALATVQGFPGVSSEPPQVRGFALDALRDLPNFLGVQALHDRGIKGRGVRLAMVDTGFAHGHPFFVDHGFTSRVVLAPGATRPEGDRSGHGTGESANVFAIAPEVEFIGVKLNDDDDFRHNASILEGLQALVPLRPHVISLSMAYDLRDPLTNGPAAELNQTFRPLVLEIEAAIERGAIFVAAAGNGEYAFPAQMPTVLAIGGVYRSKDGDLMASNFASSFASAIYDPRSVPDCCGLVGQSPGAPYIKLPVPPGSDMDRLNAGMDGTEPDDGWAVFSGTSAAAPQVAAVCALLLSAPQGATAEKVRAAVCETCVDVTRGASSRDATASGQRGRRAGPGHDPATGAGLVDAKGAWEHLFGPLAP